MASSGTIYGSFSGISSSNVRPYIYWEVQSQSITGNYSVVHVEVWYERVNTAYYGYNLTGNATCNVTVDGTKNSANITFDLRGDTIKEKVRDYTQNVYHNNDGTKACYIGSDGDTKISWGTHNFGATVTLPTIPREAYLTNNVDFTIENDIPLSIHNDGNLYVQAQLYVNGTLIKTQNLGKVTSATFTTNATEESNIYAQCPNSTSVGGYMRIKTYSDSGYTSQVGSNRDKNLTAYVNTTTNKPTFTNYSVANVDKTITVTDKYGNNLGSSSTSTLLGTDSRVIKGYSKVRATIAVADKMIAKNHATGNKYRFTAGLYQVEANYSDDSDVALDLDNVTTGDYTVTAYDSRLLATGVNKSLDITDYSDVVIYSVTPKRDNMVDSKTKLSVSGKYFKGYFGGGTSGVENTLTLEYRYKPTTDSWGTQTWNAITATVNSDGTFSFNDYVDGDLGVNGFDSNKSFSIEVRAYDKLSATIKEATLNVGQPVLDITQKGIAVGGRFSSTLQGSSNSPLQAKGGIDILPNGTGGNTHFNYGANDDAYITYGNYGNIRHHDSSGYHTVIEFKNDNKAYFANRAKQLGYEIVDVSTYLGKGSKIYLSADQGIGYNSIQRINYNSTNWNYGGMADTGNHRLVAQHSGMHLAIGNVGLKGLKAGNKIYFELRKNGGAFGSGGIWAHADTDYWEHPPVAGSIWLNAGDYVEGFCAVYGSGGSPTFKSSSVHTTLELIPLSFS